ncbi:ATP-binding protein [Kineococcus sp. SYSU DK006]|uniref:ATP-binding protein n=1 Tax=Kineococcus sp. SYSU DK006 TaxID=3383127 RepID=UPI003D7E7F20
MGRSGEAAGAAPRRRRAGDGTRHGAGGRAPAGTSVGVRLTRALGVVLALLLLVGAVGAAGLVVTGRSSDRETRLQQLEAANAALRTDVADADTALRAHRATGSPELLEDHREAVAALPAHRESTLALVSDPLQRSLLAEQTRLLERWTALTAAGPGAGASADATAALDELRDANTRLDALVRRQRHDAAAEQDRARSAALTGTALTLLVALALVVRTGARTRRALVDPLQRLVDVLDAHGRGDRRAAADPAHGPSEVRTVARAVNDLAEENRRLLQAAERAAALQRLAGDIGREVRDQLVAEDAVQVAVERLGAQLGVDRVWVRMLQEGGSGPLGAITRGWARSPLLPLADHPGLDELSVVDDARSWLHELHTGGGVHAVPDTRALTGRSAAADAFLRASDARALLLVPIGGGDTPHGLLTVVCCAGPRDFGAEEVELTRSVAVDLARALVLAGLYRAQERLLAELRDVESVKSDLLATVSHELRTPLTSISGYLDLLRDGAVGEVPADVAAVLGIVERNTERLRALIEDLLLLARVEAAPAQQERGSTAVADLVTGVLAAVGAGPSTGGSVRCTTPADDLAGVRVRGDAEHLHRALLAVVDNAVKFSPLGSLVRLRVERHPQEVRIVVQDNGMGIPAGEVPVVFGRFARGSNATVLAVPGTGLGLTIARDLVRLHGGRVDLDSVEGRGTTAVVALPPAVREPS